MPLEGEVCFPGPRFTLSPCKVILRLPPPPHAQIHDAHPRLQLPALPLATPPCVQRPSAAALHSHVHGRTHQFASSGVSLGFSSRSAGPMNATRRGRRGRSVENRPRPLPGPLLGDLALCPAYRTTLQGCRWLLFPGVGWGVSLISSLAPGAPKLF